MGHILKSEIPEEMALCRYRSADGLGLLLQGHLALYSRAHLGTSNPGGAAFGGFAAGADVALGGGGPKLGGAAFSIGNSGTNTRCHVPSEKT